MKRYDCDTECFGGEDYLPKMVEEPLGDYVLYTDHAAEVEKLEGELVEQARLLGMGGEREAKLMAEVAALRERVRVLEEAVKQTPHDTMEFTGRCETWCRRCKLDAALAQPQPCKTCGGKGYETHALGWMPCPDCKPQQKEGE